jgi:hypothetical protein
LIDRRDTPRIGRSAPAIPVNLSCISTLLLRASERGAAAGAPASSS